MKKQGGWNGPHKAAQYGFDLLQANEKESVHMMGNHAREQGGRMHWCWKSIWNGNAFVVEARMKNLQELPKLRDSITYLYLEHAAIEQNDAAIIAIPKDGLPIPIAAMTCLLLDRE